LDSQDVQHCLSRWAPLLAISSHILAVVLASALLRLVYSETLGSLLLAVPSYSYLCSYLFLLMICLSLLLVFIIVIGMIIRIILLIFFITSSSSCLYYPSWFYLYVLDIACSLLSY